MGKEECPGHLRVCTFLLISLRNSWRKESYGHLIQNQIFLYSWWIYILISSKLYIAGLFRWYAAKEKLAVTFLLCFVVSAFLEVIGSLLYPKNLTAYSVNHGSFFVYQMKSIQRIIGSQPTCFHTIILAHQASLSMEFSRKEYKSRYPFPSPGDRPDPEWNLGLPPCRADSLMSEPPGKPIGSFFFFQLWLSSSRNC